MPMIASAAELAPARLDDPITDVVMTITAVAHASKAAA